MFIQLGSLVFTSFIVASNASPFSRNMVVHEKRSIVPSGFTTGSAPSPDQVLKLQVALVNSDIAGLESKLYDVSTPKSSDYGKYLSKEEVEAYVAPTSDTFSKVQAFFSTNGIQTQNVSAAGDWLSFSIPVSKANAMFDANFTNFIHSQSGQQLTRTLSYSIPSDLQGHISFVHPTTAFVPSVRKFPASLIPTKKDTSRLIKRQNSACDPDAVDPTCLQSLYGIPTNSSGETSNILGVSGFIEQFANKDDLATFLTQFRPDLSNGTTFSEFDVDGGENDQNADDAGVEANLDIQYTVGVASDVPVEFISVGEDNSDGLSGFIDEANALLNLTSGLPTVLTTSYGFNEDEIPLDLANTLCNAYMQLGARGVSVLYASGDGGVSGSQSEDCTDFIPTFPSGCPFLTSVGATQGSAPETAASFSAGGFSNLFSQPTYQSSAVATYLQSLGSTNAGLFNSSGRAYPDVSAQGVNVSIFVGGEEGTVDGTSCASPIFASVIALLNDRLIAAGKPTLGFLNPFLYSEGVNALNDITTGDNPGCGTNGFPAQAGWDPVTGLGTPNFESLLTAVGL